MLQLFSIMRHIAVFQSEFTDHCSISHTPMLLLLKILTKPVAEYSNCEKSELSTHTEEITYLNKHKFQVLFHAQQHELLP